MANRQYVGARYVPKFYQGSNGNEWDSGVVYEALTMVTYLGSTYCSKKPVPARTVAPNLDTEYWVLTAAYSSQVAELREEVEGIESDITDNIKPDILANTSAIATNTSSINTLNKKVRILEERNVIFIGDSYADSNRGGYAKGWITVVENILGLDASHSHIYQKGGAGFVGAGQGKTFDDLADDCIADITTDRDTITDIVICGGCNDASSSISEADLASAILTVIQKLHTTFPNAIIRIGAIGGFLKYSSTDYLSRVYLCYYNYYTTMSYLMPIMNANVPMLMATSYDSDGIHPVQAGIVRIGTVIGTAIKSNSNYGKISTNGSMPITAKSGFTIGGEAPLISLEENGIRICTRNNVNISGNITYAAGTNLIDIGTLEGNSIISTVSAQTSLPTFAQIPINLEIYGQTETGGSLLIWYDSTANKLTATIRIEGISIGSLPFTSALLRIRPFNILISSIV